MRCSAFIATSVDGFIARADGRLDWLSVVERAGEDYGYAKFFASVDTLIVGRSTYDVAAAFPEWPWTGKRVVVLTHRALALRDGVEAFAGDARDLVDRLAREGAVHAYVDGGDVIRQFVAASLLDRLTLSIVPVLLGDGVRLFGVTAADARLKLVTSATYESGLVQVTYALPAASSLEVVTEWEAAVSGGDLERALALSAPDVEVGGPRGSGRGHALVREWVARTGIRLERLRVFRRDGSVVVEQRATWNDDPATVRTIATLFEVKDGLVTRVVRYDDLDAALDVLMRR